VPTEAQFFNQYGCFVAEAERGTACGTGKFTSWKPTFARRLKQAGVTTKAADPVILDHVPS
jgi:hypothetical protein